MSDDALMGAALLVLFIRLCCVLCIVQLTLRVELL